MAITKLAHLKESKTGPVHRHLKHALSYILNPDKTEGGIWTGGSITPDPSEALRVMLDTKEEFGKTYGRQGYHFVISFSPGECDEKTAFLLGRDFCERCFGSEFQYVFAVHNDQAHMHCHIVFNSVSCIDGRKYRYEAGDWEKYIQPITDDLCRKYGLSELVYDRKNKTGVSYAERSAAKEGRMTWKDVIRADIDAAAAKAGSFEEYIRILTGMGYRIHEDVSEKYGSYLAYIAPGADRARRDFRLGEGYRKSDIEQRILHKDLPVPETKLPDRPAVLYLKGNSYLQIAFIRRVRQATDWRYFAFKRKEQARVRKDLIKLEWLSEEASYLLEKDIRSEAEVRGRLLEVKSEIRRIRRQHKTDTVADAQEKSHHAIPVPASLLRERRILMRIIKEIPETEAVREIPLVMDAPRAIKAEEVITHD